MEEGTIQMTNPLSPFSTLSSFIEEGTPNPIQQFMKKLAGKPCDDDPEEDCTEIKSPCCQEDLKTVFGTLPLEVYCTSCSKKYLLRDLVQKELTTV
jgi:hypothetical protein